MINLDLEALVVESFPTADSDPAQGLLIPTRTEEQLSECCDNDLYEVAATYERICSTT